MSLRAKRSNLHFPNTDAGFSILNGRLLRSQKALPRNDKQASQYEKWDKTYLWHPFTQHYLWEKEPTLIIESGRGAYLKDIHGRRYLDGVSSLWVNLHGHNHPELNRAVRRQLSKIAHSTFLGLSHVPAIKLGRELARIAPPGLRRTFYSDSGAAAVEIALKMAYQYWIERKKVVIPAKASRSIIDIMSGRTGRFGTGIQAVNLSLVKTGSPIRTFGDDDLSPRSARTEFLAVKGSYHGDTIGAVSVGGIGAFHSKFKPLLFKTNFAMAPACPRCPFNKTGVRHRSRTGETVKSTPRPGDRRPETGCRWECLGDVEKILKRKAPSIAAGILEPVVQGAAGMVVLPPGYVAGFRRLLKKYNVLFIADEVATGFCRTGSLFACDQEKAAPDILCLAKSLTGGYSPLAVTMTTEKIFKTFRAPPQKMKTFFHGHSYTAHPLGTAAALANLRLIRNTKLLEKTRRKAHLLKQELRALQKLGNVTSIRQAGLMAGVEIGPFHPSLRMGARVCRALLSYGIWVRPLGDTIVLMPPPVISDFDLRRMVRSLKSVLLNECQT